MFRPDVHTETETLAGYLGLQLEAIRASAYGLTEAQARSTPCRSSLSIGGLIKHATYVCQGRQRRGDGGAVVTAESYALFHASFALTEAETLAGAIAEFDAAVATYLTDVGESDPAADDLEPPAPWFGRNEATRTKHRYYLVHHVEEFARHAGHADIIREQIDGATSPELSAAVHGRPANNFVTPWAPPVDQPE